MKRFDRGAFDLFCRPIVISISVYEPEVEIFRRDLLLAGNVCVRHIVGEIDHNGRDHRLDEEEIDPSKL